MLSYTLGGLQVYDREGLEVNELMTEGELIQFLRIPEISNSNNHHNVIEHLKRFRDLPRIHLCNKALYPKKAILDWIEKETTN
jgi:hypothetical protein